MNVSAREFILRLIIFGAGISAALLMWPYVTPRADDSRSPRTVAAPIAATTAPGVSQFDPETQCVAKVPRTWGEYKGGSSQSGLAFEAPDGTLRFLTNLLCGSQPVVALKTVRTEKGSSN
jgi:hypothetical protein